MAISFNQVPNTIRVPWAYVEFDNSRAVQGPSIQPYKILVVGQRTAAGSKPELQVDSITSNAQAIEYYGNGSMIQSMIEKVLLNNRVTSMDAISLDDAGGSVKAENLIAFGTTLATEAGVVSIYISGKRVRVPVAVGDTDLILAQAFVDAVNADDSLQVTAIVNGNDPTATEVFAKNAGFAGNEIDVRENYFPGEERPAGVNVVIDETTLHEGVANPDVSGILTAIGDEQYNVIIFPYSDIANLDVMKTLLDERFGPLKQNDGMIFVGKRDTHANLVTFGDSRNTQFESFISATGPMAPWEWAAAYGATAALNLQIDPARPLQTLEMKGILAPNRAELFTLEERNLLLFDGISTFYVDASGAVRIERAITSYQENQFGAPDTSYLDVNTFFTLSYLRYDFRNTMLRKYPRHKLANDGNRFAPGQAIMTPSVGKAEAVSIFRGWQELGLVENIDQFKNDLIVERNVTDPNRLDFLLPADLINQLRVIGAQIQFLL